MTFGRTYEGIGENCLWQALINPMDGVYSEDNRLNDNKKQKLMSRYETTVEQEINDHGLGHVLGLGRGVLKVGRLSEDLERREDVDATIDFISEIDQAGSSGHNFIDSLTAQSPSTADVLEGLSKCSVRDAVNALLGKGADSQRRYLAGRLEEYAELVSSGIPVVERKYKDGEYVNEITGYRPAEAEDIRTGLWRDVVFASMIGTPELGALTMARNHMRHVSQGDSEEARHVESEMRNLPKIRGYHSYIFPSKMRERGKHENNEYVELPPEFIDGEVGYAFPELAKTYQQVLRRVKHSNPELDDAGLEHKAVRELARLIEKSTDYNPAHRGEGSPYRAHFAEQLAWAQLGEQTQRQLRGMRQKIMGVDLHNIGRFIGKSGDNPYEKEWRRIEQFAGSVSPDDVSSAREYFLLLAQKQIERQHKTLGNEAATVIILEGSASIDAINQMSDEAILSRFSKERSRLEQKRNSRMSLAQKALILRFTDKPENDESLIDWVNDAPFGLINRTHTMLTRGVSKETAFAYAVAEHAFPGETLTHELLDACRGATRETLDRTRALSQKLTETNQAISLEDRLILGRVSNRHDAEDVFDLLMQGYSASQVEQYPWLCHLNTSEIIDFPASGGESQKQKWLAERGYAYLNGGWNKNSIGKIIATRLDSGIESSVHDASQWLETFQMPEEGYDIQTLKALLRDGEISDISQVEKIRFHDTGLENMLIAGILHASQELRDRLLLPGKAQKVQSMFFAPENQLIYTTLVGLYKNPDLSVEMLREAALSRIDEFFEQWLVNAHGKDTTHRISKDDLQDRLVATLQNIDSLDFPVGENITGVISRLGKYGESRKRYIDDATSWLTRHMTTPSTRLTKVWDDRATALAEGIGDSARDIESWQANNALRKHLMELERTGTMPSNLTVNEVVTEYRGWVDELSRTYGSERVVRAISEFKSIRTSEALLPPATIDLTTDDGVYKAEVLAKDDPRGATIGVDTGCCMTLDGASADCIRSGYQDSSAGFFALYTPQGRLAAQSYFYVNPEHPDVLVLDNIEANQGRDTNKIVKLYQEALVRYLTERFTSDSEWKIRTVHVGTGYGNAVKSTVLQLPQAPTVRNKPGIYTDAHDQRRLLEISDKQIAEAKEKTIQIEQTEKVRPQHYPEIAVHGIHPEQAEVIRELEKQIYPKHMRQYRDREMLTEELHMRGMGQFSFLVAGEADSSRDFLGYCMAYLEQSETDPSRTDPVLYAADLAILPDAQGGRVGSKMFEELLERANAHGIDKVELHARETTSYAALMQSSWVQRLLYNQGYKLVDHGNLDEFDDEQGNIEKLYLVSLEKV